MTWILMIILVTFLKQRSKAASKALLSPSRKCIGAFFGVWQRESNSFFHGGIRHT